MLSGLQCLNRQIGSLGLARSQWKMLLKDLKDGLRREGFLDKARVTAKLTVSGVLAPVATTTSM